MIMARLQRTADNNIRAASAARATASATVNAAATGLVDLTTTEDTNLADIELAHHLSIILCTQRYLGFAS